MFACVGYAAEDRSTPLKPFSFERRDPGPKDVQIDILYCGVCHSDLHQVRDEWHNTTFPCVPGHEIVGRITAVGAEVGKFKVGDLAGVGCLVDSCRTCPNCRDGLEQYCDNGFVATYNSPDTISGGVTFGGYSKAIVVDQDFVLRIPESLDLKAVAPLLCAGITTYSPMRHWKVSDGQKVGVVGLGGLGHMAVKIAHALGAEVYLFTTSPSKAEDAKRLGATDVILSKDPLAMNQNADTFDFIIDTVSADHDVNGYLKALKRDGTFVQVGAPTDPLQIAAFSVIWKRRQFAGSLIGGIAETQEMLDFCAEHGIVSDVEMIAIADIETAYTRMVKSDVKYRFVIDMASMPAAA